MNSKTTITTIAIAAVAGAVFYVGSESPDAPEATTAFVDNTIPAETVAAKTTHPSHSLDRTGANRDDFAGLNAMREEVVTLPSGVQYEMFVAGTGETPGPNDIVLVRYHATLPDGRVFDTTVNKEEPLSLPLDTIAVPGLREALLLMSEGAHWRVVIPPSEGYGRSGNNRLRRHDLIYDIRVVSVEPAA